VRGAARALRQLQRALQDDDRGDGDWHADVEAPAPPDAVGDHAAEQRPGDGADGHDGAEQAHVATALARGDEVGQDHLGERSHAARADALQHAAGDQPARRLRCSGEDRADRVDHQRALHEPLAVEQVGELAPDRGAHGQRQQGGGDDPGIGRLAAAELGDDPRQRRRDDRAGEDRDEQAQQQAGHGLEHLAVRHGRPLGRGEMGGGHAASLEVLWWVGCPAVARS
jgi:hypothetical protein